MKQLRFLMLVILTVLAIGIQASAETCNTFTAHCACFPAVPFEGYKMHVVEVCDGKEEWFTEYDAPTFDSETDCQAAIKTDQVCKSL